MVDYCCVFGCKNNIKSHPNLAYYSFPEEHERFVSWLKAIDREDIMINNENKSVFRVCQVHFESSQLSDGVELDKTAVPTLLLPQTINIKQEPIVALKEEPIDEIEEAGSSTTYTHSLKSSDVKKEISTAGKISNLTVSPQEIIIIPPDKSLSAWTCGTQTDPYYTHFQILQPSYKARPITSSRASQTGAKLLNKEIHKRIKTFKLSPKLKSRLTLRNFHVLCDTFLNEKLAQIVKMQTKINSRGGRHVGNRFGPEFRELCAELRSTSPQAFSKFKEIFTLPATRTLLRWQKQHSVQKDEKSLQKSEDSSENDSDEEANDQNQEHDSDVDIGSSSDDSDVEMGSTSVNNIETEMVVQDTT